MVTAEQTHEPDATTESETATATMLEEEPDDEHGEEIAKDDLFHVLQNERRRRVLAYLLDQEGPFEMRSIAEQVAAWEHDTTVRQLMSDERQRVYIALYQSHLPKLDEVGLIDYQQNRGVVEATDRLDDVGQYIDHPEGEESEQTEEADEETDPVVGPLQVAMGAVAVSLLLTASAWLGAVPGAALSGVEAATVVTGLFASTVAGLSWFADDED